MKRLGMILACCGAMALVGGTLLAVPDEPLPETSEKKNPPAEEKGPVLRGAHAIMAKVCQLSEDQKKKIAERQAERNQALKQYQLDNAEKLKSLQENLKKAKQASNKEAIKRARKELASLSAQQGKISKKARDDIMAVLTDQQKVKWRQYNLFTSVKRSFNTAELTDEQLKKIEILCEKTDPTVDPSDAKARLAMRHRLCAQVEKNILTDEQRGRSVMIMIQRLFKKADLTEEQLVQIKAEYTKLMAKVDPANVQARAGVQQKLIEKVKSDILTEKQRDAMTSKKPPQKTEKPKLY